MLMFFQMLLYILGSILLTILIILSVKLINTIDKTNEILEDIDGKVKTLDGFFNAISVTSNAISSISDKFMDKVFSIVSKITRNKRKKSEEEEDYE